MRYIIIDEVNGDMFTYESDSLECAKYEMESQWDSLSEYDRNRRISFYLLESINPDIDAENHLDGCILKAFK